MLTKHQLLFLEIITKDLKFAEIWDKNCAVSSDLGFVSNILSFLAVTCIDNHNGSCKVSSQYFNALNTVTIDPSPVSCYVDDPVVMYFLVMYC